MNSLLYQILTTRERDRETERERDVEIIDTILASKLKNMYKE